MANSNFLKLFERNHGEKPDARKIINELRELLLQNKLEISPETSKALLNYKMFRLARDYDRDKPEGSLIADEKNKFIGQEYSINDLKSFSPESLKNKVFESIGDINASSTLTKDTRNSGLLGSKYEFKFFTINLCVIDEAKMNLAKYQSRLQLNDMDEVS